MDDHNHHDHGNHDDEGSRDETGVVEEDIQDDEQRTEQSILEAEADADEAEQELKARSGHRGHGRMDHGSYGNHGSGGMHEGHEQMFRRRFFVSTLLSIPVLLYSEMLQEWLGVFGACFSR